MKHSIHINQKSCIENGFDLDFIDLAIFDVMVFFANSPKCKTMTENEKIYYWFSWKLLVNELPLMGIKTRDGIRKRLLNLRNAQLIEPHEDNQSKAMSWFCFGEKYELMFTSPAYNDIPPCIQQYTPPAYNNIHPLHTNVCTIKDTIDKETINKEITNEQNSILSKKQEIENQFNELWIAYKLKIGRANALKAFEKAIKKTDLQTLIESAKIYDLHLQNTKSEKFKKHLSTWLNGKHWEDEYATSEIKPYRQSKFEVNYDF